MARITIGDPADRDDFWDEEEARRRWGEQGISAEEQSKIWVSLPKVEGTENTSTPFITTSQVNSALSTTVEDRLSKEETPEQEARRQTDEAVRQAKEIGAFNLGRAKEITDVATRSALSSASAIDSFMSERFFRNIENILPDFREQIIGSSKEALETTRNLARELSTGDLPADVRDMIERTRAELGISQGLFGRSALFATARDLGKRKLDLKLQGANLFANVVSPLSQRLLSQTFQLTPPVTDVPGLFTQAQQIAAGSSMISPSTVLGTAANAGLAASAQAWERELSVMNAQMDIYQTNLQADLNRKAIKQSQTNAMIAGGAKLGAAALGGFSVDQVGAGDLYNFGSGPSSAFSI